MHPYKELKSTSFWKKSISDVHYLEIANLWDPMPIHKNDKIATGGSCFAQYIGHNLSIRGANFLDMEPAPPIFSNKEEEKKWGFGVFSCRYGNIYTSKQLLQLFEEAFESRAVSEVVWRKKDRYFDALRPNIDPIGQETEEKILELRKIHLSKVKKMFQELDVFVFTMGLTECWVNNNDNTVYPTAPGTIAGEYDKNKYSFVNLRYSDVLSDMSIFWDKLKKINPSARMLLTVSPVPLVATATETHVLAATTYSKSVLRAVAGDLSSDNKDIYYFPSYEIISSAPSRGFFYNYDMRAVNSSGVDFVMSHFFSGSIGDEFNNSINSDDTFDPLCDEEEAFREL